MGARVRCTFENCNKTFSCKANLRDHVNEHLGIKEHVCSICGKAFSCKKYLKSHALGHSSSFSCENCGKIFNREYALKKHLKLYCKKEPHSCAFCGKKYQRKKCLETHEIECSHIIIENNANAAKISRKRPESRIVVCETCKLEFSGKNNLRNHVRAAHEKVRYRCKFCGRMFSYNCSLRRHVHKIHNSSETS